MRRLALLLGSAGLLMGSSTGLSTKLLSLASLCGVLGVEESSEPEYLMAMIPVEVSIVGLIAGVDWRSGCFLDALLRKSKPMLWDHRSMMEAIVACLQELRRSSMWFVHVGMSREYEYLG